jgi:O-antigen biosynthesis protein
MAVVGPAMSADDRRATRPAVPQQDSCDIVIAVHNGLDVVDDCVSSVLRHTTVPGRVIVVDDASDSTVAQYLQRLSAADSRVLLLTNETNQGFVRSTNRGLFVSTAPYICLLNSDTVVTAGWMEGLLRCAKSDSGIQVVNPVSNAAVNISVQLSPGLGVHTMALAVAAHSRRLYPDVVTAVGFCFLVTRAAVERYGGFDEIYGAGYCEESDYCMRVTTNGGRVVVADDTFVYHRGGATFGRSRERYLRNRKIFDQRWADRYEPDYAEFLSRNPLHYLRHALVADLNWPPPSEPPPAQPTSSSPLPAAVDPLWRMTLDAWNKGGLAGVVSKIPTIPGHVVRSLSPAPVLDAPSTARSVEVLPDDPEQLVRFRATPEYCRKLPHAAGLKIAFLVWSFEIFGGVLAITQLANRLVLAGHSVVLATLGAEPLPGQIDLYTRPLVFASVDDMAKGLGNVDIVVATFWPTAAEWLPTIKSVNPTIRTSYFVQDYEVLFDDGRYREEIVGSYQHADLRVVTSQWLAGLLAQHGHESVVIPVGVDARVFYPRDRAPNHVPRILMQARPHNAYRGFREALAVLTCLQRRGRSFEAVFYGCNDDVLRAFDMPFACTNAGVVTDRTALAKLYATCDILYDPSHFQAFGLPGLEAMACGVPTVLPKRGGLTEYAVDGVNTLLADCQDVAASADALERLLVDDVTRRSITAAGLQTQARFSIQRMADEHLAAYERLCRTARPVAS